MKGVSVIKRLSRMSPQYSLLTIYKSFVLLHFDYGDVLYDQLNNKEVCVKNKVFNTMLLLLSPLPSRVYLK